jgi:hypothetical protein
MKQILFTIIVIFAILPYYCWAIEDEDSDLSDAQSEMDAQKDMLAYVQTTISNRFGADLKVGDSVTYEKIEKTDDEENSISKLEVMSRDGNTATIKKNSKEIQYFIRSTWQKAVFWKCMELMKMVYPKDQHF